MEIPDGVAVGLADHLPPVFRQELRQDSLHLPVEARVGGQVAVRGHEEVHVHTVGQVTQLVELVHRDVLQVGHLQHVGHQERALQRVHVTRVDPAPVDVAEDDGEDVAGDAVDGDGLVPGLGHAAGEHGEEVLAVCRQDHPVAQECLSVNNENNVGELFILKLI